NVGLIHAGGAGEKSLVNTREIPLDQIRAIGIHYRSDTITLVTHDSDTLIIREYMSRNNSRFFADIRSSDGELVIRAGNRPQMTPRSVRAHVKIFIPASDRSTSVRNTSGRIVLLGEHAASSFELQNTSGGISIESARAGRVRAVGTSGGISLASVIADEIDVESSSGRIIIGDVYGTVSARTSSGGIELGTANGAVNARSSSGGIELGTVNGAVDARSSSGSIRFAVTENTGDITVTASSGAVAFAVPRDLAFNVSIRTSSGRLNTPFNDALSRPLDDRNLIRGVIGSVPQEHIQRNININTSSGSINAEWLAR
ncbi:MAG: DUF4097 domain-containing protein, partial [Treponema sp.]|nr:DUF4097 domain-containing protein [Treponema sp.]